MKNKAVHITTISKMKNKAVYITTITVERFICIILEENKFYYTYKGEYGQGVIYKDEIKEIEIIGVVEKWKKF